LDVSSFPGTPILTFYKLLEIERSGHIYSYMLGGLGGTYRLRTGGTG